MIAIELRSLPAVPRAIRTLLLTSALISTACADEPIRGPEGAHLVLDHATVIDVRDGQLSGDRAVWIGDDRILEIGRAGAEPPVGVERVDLDGAYLIPGLWDMHIHWYHSGYLPLFIANGVTGVRQMFGDPSHLEWRERIASGELVGPRQEIGSRIVDGPEPIWPASITAVDADAGRAAVAVALGEGADFIKVYSLLSRESYLAIAEEARTRGVPFAGHVPSSISLLDAADAGQRSVEHLTGVLIACSTDEARFREQRRQGELPWWQDSPLIETYSAERATELFARLAASDTWMCPTLTVLRSGGFGRDASLRDDPRLEYMPATLRDRWAAPPRWADDPDSYFADGRASFAKSLEIVGEMHRAGVKILAGTDVLNPYCLPGFSLHDELALLVEAGLTPLDALRAATLSPARFLEREAELGTVEAGKLADLVVLTENPLERIEHTTSIAGVVAAGRWFDRAALDALLDDVRELANEPPSPPAEAG